MDKLILKYAAAAAVCGLIPIGGSMCILLLELCMFYHICAKYHVPALHKGIGFIIALFGISFLFKGVAEALHAIPVIGQLANSLVAFGVVMVLGKAINNYAKNGGHLLEGDV
jgi:uncharacterized protein (DUF697 family)